MALASFTMILKSYLTEGRKKAAIKKAFGQYLSPVVVNEIARDPDSVKMGGEEAIGLLLEIDPRAGVVVWSGYSDSPVMSRYRSYGFIGVLPKPYDIDEVDRVIRKLLVG